jgi:seryl-tRNA synthetase
MITLAQIRENKEFVIERLKVKNFDAKALIGQIIDLDLNRRQIQVDSDARLNEMNQISKNIGLLFKQTYQKKKL